MEPDEPRGSRPVLREAGGATPPAYSPPDHHSRDGKVWLFGVIEHWNAEMLGWHVAKHGTRYEAIQALGMAVRQQFGHLSAGAARGLALRHDHGSNFMADVFQKQIKFWGLAPSYAFVAEPETNG